MVVFEDRSSSVVDQSASAVSELSLVRLFGRQTSSAAFLSLVEREFGVPVVFASELKFFPHKPDSIPPWELCLLAEVTPGLFGVDWPQLFLLHGLKKSHFTQFIHRPVLDEAQLGTQRELLLDKYTSIQRATKYAARDCDQGHTDVLVEMARYMHANLMGFFRPVESEHGLYGFESKRADPLGTSEASAFANAFLTSVSTSSGLTLTMDGG